MIVKRSYNQMFEFNIIAGGYIEKYPDNKLTEHLKKFCEKQLKKIFEQYADEKDDLQIKNCLIDDKTKAIIYVDKQRQFSQEGELKLKSELKELNKKEVDVHSRIIEGIDYLIDLLTEDEKESFTGILI